MIASVSVNHPAYSPDLAPSNYFQFRSQKPRLRVIQFTNSETLKIAVKAWFDSQDGEYYFARHKHFRRKVQKNAMLLQDNVLKNDSMYDMLCNLFIAKLQNFLIAPSYV